MNFPPHTITPIGEILSPFKEKFGIPRQPGLCPAAKGAIKLCGEFNNEHIIKDINQHTHIWVLFLFHQNLEQGWKDTVKAPRLGGNKKTGVFATRSTFRPNGIGMSVLPLLDCKLIDNHWHIEVQGLDLLDRTPVIDIKPYIPYSDCLPHAQSHMAQQAPELLREVTFEAIAIDYLNKLKSQYPTFKELITQVLQQDPRPAYKQKNRNDDKLYGIKLHQYDVMWRVVNGNVVVETIKDNHV